MNPIVRELLDLFVRWFHVIAGIMWIGNSMLWNWMDRNLRPDPDAKEGHEGRIFMIHSGGFYDVEKKQLQPNELPKELHWFMYQNLSTWVSGILLLVIVYYMGGAAYMIDPSVANISFPTAVGIGVGSLVVSWLFYDGLWRSPLGKNTPLSFVISFAYIAAVTYGLTHVLSGRAAYIHVGAILGTIMTGNVWMHIIPSQKQLVEATKRGEKADPALGKAAKTRSIHNNYMTFPVIFIMISNHFASTYGNRLNWLVLIVLALGGAGVRHFMNIRFTYKNWLPALSATAACAIAALVFLLTLPAPGSEELAQTKTAATDKVPFAMVQAVVSQRCVSCHSARPTDATFAVAPAGVMLDTPAEIQALAPRIKQQAVLAKTMPLGNKTGMTDSERALLARWIDQGGAIAP